MVVNRHVLLVVLVALTLCLLGCQEPPQSTAGFVLPAGDPAAGETAFRDLRCYDCHRVEGVDMPVAEQPDQVLVELGGEVSRVKTYGDLLDSIVNPSHRLAPQYQESLVAIDGKSKMTNYNQVMTVQQLADLVAFLQPTYQLREVPPPNYPVYPYQ
ncbi:c-type cytochrome [Botrimarina sp.]|uniref:c-type cytochrome n=1 Tax=Botrimarina sp. TaxID=2795802 RepID=UPI0032EF943D